MTTDNKTLATAKHGGCVQLPTSERERFEAWADGSGRSTARFNDGGYCDERTVSAWLAWQAALSAQPTPATCKEGLQVQPSPGGQGDALAMIGANLRSIVRLCRPGDYSISRADAGDIHMEADHALQLLEAALAARLPVGDAVAWMTHHDEPMLFPTAAEAATYCDDDEPPIPLYAAAPAQAEDLGAAIPDTPEVRDILGRPNFWCSPWANVLRMRGDEIPHKAEEEQAAVIRFMLNHYLAHGAAWAEVAGDELDAIRKADSQAVGNG